MSGFLLYLVGQPGSGKTTVIENLTAGLEPESVETRPFAHIVWGDGIVELGARREGFSGTDTLSMSVQPKVLDWLRSEAPPYVLGEGDRLANQKFFRGVLAAGWDLDVMHLQVSDEVARYRRAARAHELGVPLQDEAWLRGRVTKVRNLAAEFPMLPIDADRDEYRVVSAVRRAGNPVVERLDALVAFKTA
jgi:hypothetical protein